MKRTTMRTGLLTLLAGLVACGLLAGTAAAEKIENVLVTKIASTSTLKLEDGITVKVQPSTEIRNQEGERIKFEDIPDPAEMKYGMVVLSVEGPKTSSGIQATKLKIEEILRN